MKEVKKKEDLQESLERSSIRIAKQLEETDLESQDFKVLLEDLTDLIKIRNSVSGQDLDVQKLQVEAKKYNLDWKRLSLELLKIFGPPVLAGIVYFKGMDRAVEFENRDDVRPKSFPAWKGASKLVNICKFF